MRIKIVKAESWNWYKDEVGKTYVVRDDDKYQPYGVQVYRYGMIENNALDAAGRKCPDVVQNGHYEYI